MRFKLKNPPPEIKSLEEFSKSIFESITSGIVIVDSDGKIIRVNESFAELLDYPREELINGDVDIFFPASYGEESIFKKTLKNKREYNRLELNIEKKDGKTMILGMSTSLLKDKKGNVKGAIGIVRDLTDSKELEERMKRSERLASLGEMAASLAHEIRNPLSGMKLGIDSLKKSIGGNKDASEILNIVEGELKRLNRFVIDMTSYSKRPKPVLSPCDIREIIERNITLLKKDFESLKIKVKKNYPEKLGKISLDDDQIGEVFLNLFLNAKDAMPDGGILSINLQSLSKNLVAEVEDTGTGIPPGKLKKVFDPFFSTKKGGTGLGLSIIYRIICDHKGTIGVESKEGKGTKFTIVLPK